MAEDNLKPKSLVIDVEKASVPNGTAPNQWEPLTNLNNFIHDIITPTLTKDTNVGALVSGIPTALARVNLFKDAVDDAASSKPGDKAGNMSAYYQQLVREWHGLIACMALDYTKLQVRRIDLVYSDGKPMAETANMYEPKGAFGNMLLEQRPLWSDQGQVANSQLRPFIDLVKYDGQVVGGTSPMTLLFTSTGYHIDNAKDRPWVDVTTGLFTDPLESSLSETQTATLHKYVQHILQHLAAVAAHYQGLDEDLRPQYNSVRRDLEAWAEAIAQYAADHRYNLDKGSIPPVDAMFSLPFSMALNFKDELYGLEGSIFESPQPNAAAFDPKRLLLPRDSAVARVILPPKYVSDPDLVKKMPVYLLRAQMKGEPGQYAYFALPLSAMGLNIFGRSLASLLGQAPEGTQVKSQLLATFDPDAEKDNLEVVLKIQTNEGHTRDFKVVYTVGEREIQQKDILLWPNFISRRWRKYYLYSEMPHNQIVGGYSARPFVGDMHDKYFRIITDEEKEPIYLAERGRLTAPEEKVKARLLVASDTRVSDIDYKYEIYASDQPFKGVSLFDANGQHGGYLMIQYDHTAGNDIPENLLDDTNTSYDEAILGIDFGSTNTSVAYLKEGQSMPTGFEYTNQRISLLGQDTTGGNARPRENEILFFPSRPRHSNAIKSVLTLHNERRLPSGREGEGCIEKEVQGGFPCFVDNLPVASVTDDVIKLNYPRSGITEQIHNMKWTKRPNDEAHKQAFLSTLMLQTYAQLFYNKIIPTKLRWSYPSAMNTTLLTSYEKIWTKLAEVTPVVDTAQNDQPVKLDIAKFVNRDGASLSAGVEEDVFGVGDLGASSPAGESSLGGDDPFGDFNLDAFGTEPAPAAKPSAAEDDFLNLTGEETKAKKASMPDFKADDPNRTVNFSPTKLDDGTSNNALTEAAAVANYLPTRTNVGDRGVLTMCFDIGGSTTDISALFTLDGDRLTMVKQNSVRFAAQRVSAATKSMPQFHEVLKKVCRENHLQIVGLNVDEDKQYMPEKEPYYFEQVVDRLAPEQLVSFYRQIVSDCPELLAVALFVTGLLMFYAGEITTKLIEDLRRAATDEINPPVDRVKVDLQFAGKGSRLFEWLSTTQPGLAKSYYGTLFLEGMGGRENAAKMLAGINLALNSESSTEVKYEVSKGLANKRDKSIYRPKDGGKAEIVGEDGYSIINIKRETVPLAATNSLTPEMIQYIGRYFNPAEQGLTCPRFVRFAKLYYKILGQYGLKLSPDIFKEGFVNMNISQYVQNTPEYRQAQAEASRGNGQFDYVVPVILLEGMKFLDTTLIKALTKRS